MPKNLTKSSENADDEQQVNQLQVSSPTDTARKRRNDTQATTKKDSKKRRPGDNGDHLDTEMLSERSGSESSDEESSEDGGNEPTADDEREHPKKRPSTMHLIGSEQLDQIKKVLKKTISQLGEGSLKKQNRANLSADLQNVLVNLSWLPQQQPTKCSTGLALNELKNEIKSLKKAVQRQPLNSLPSADFPKLSECDRTCVFDKESGVSYAQVLALKSNKELSEQKVRIANVVTTKSDKIVVKLASQTDQEKFLAHCNANQLPARKMKSKRTRYIIKGIAEHYETSDQIVNEMLSGHENGETLRKSLEVFKTFKTGNGKQALIFYLDDEGSAALRANRDFWLGTERHRASPYIHLVQCFRCYQLGHVSSECTHSEGSFQICGKCGNQGHDRNDCISGESKHCVLCETSEAHRGEAHSHCARDGVCAVKRDWLRDQQRLIWP